MIRKILWTTLIGIICLLLVMGLYIFSLTTERPVEGTHLASLVTNSNDEILGEKADRWLLSLYGKYKVPSLSAAVSIKGEIVWAGAIGHADLDKKTPADLNTAYRVGSIAKPLTAAAFMRMQRKELVHLDDSFHEHVKDYVNNNPHYSLRQLLAHQAGIRHYNSKLSENFSNREYQSTREAAAIVEQDAPLFIPGEDFNYSTYGYTLLALAMETAYGQSFETIMHEEVFTPLQMHSTSFDKAGALNPHRATPYLLLQDILFQSPKVNLSYKYAGGGYLSTPSDIVTFASALLGDEFLDTTHAEALWTPVPLNNGEANPENYALGFRIGQDDLGKFIHHGGMSIGGYAFLIIYPEQNIVAALATNVTPMDNIFDRYSEARKLIGIFAQH